MFFYCCRWFCVGDPGHNRLPLGGILEFLHETLQQLCGLENVTRASVNVRVSSK